MTRNHDPRYTPAPDPYAHARCKCDHLVYPSQAEDDPCLYCGCQDHRRPQ